MFEWRSMDEAAIEIAAATGEDVELAVLLREAYAGRLKVCVVIPTWAAPGGGDLVFYTADGGRIGAATDGVFRHLSKHDFQALQTHKRLTLAGRRVELPNAATGGVIEAFIGPDAPTIGIGDLRVSAAEILRFVGSHAEALQRMLVGEDPVTTRRPKAVLKAIDEGVTTKVIATFFPAPLPGQRPDQWEKMLGDTPGWLEDARIDRGGRGVSARWNPAKVAICIAERGLKTRRELGRVVQDHFLDYRPEWQLYVGSFD